MRFHIFRFRPSSHSEDFTLVAKYPNPELAEKAKKMLWKLLEDMKENPDGYHADWNPDDAWVESWDPQTVAFGVYTSGS